MAESLEFNRKEEISSLRSDPADRSVVRNDALQQLAIRLRLVGSMDPQEVAQRLTLGDSAFLPVFEAEQSNQPVKLRSWEAVGRAQPGRRSPLQYAASASGDDMLGARIEAERELANSKLTLLTNRSLERVSDLLTIAVAGIPIAIAYAASSFEVLPAISAAVLAASAIGARFLARRRARELADRSGFGAFAPSEEYTHGSKESKSYLVAKRIFDIVIGSVLLLALLPIVLVAAIAIRIESKGAPFIFQTRLGKYGMPFRIIKLRGMYVDARMRFPSYYDYSQKANLDFSFHDAKDPRVTRAGWFLRRTGLDELPSLWNVVNGTMSLVGPRPEIPEVMALYGSYRTLYLSVKPGIASLSRITGRELTKREAIEFDLNYVQRHTFSLDVKILWRTLMTTLSRPGVF